MIRFGVFVLCLIGSFIVLLLSFQSRFATVKIREARQRSAKRKARINYFYLEKFSNEKTEGQSMWNLHFRWFSNERRMNILVFSLVISTRFSLCLVFFSRDNEEAKPINRGEKCFIDHSTQSNRLFFRKVSNELVFFTPIFFSRSRSHYSIISLPLYIRPYSVFLTWRKFIIYILVTPSHFSLFSFRIAFQSAKLLKIISRWFRSTPRLWISLENLQLVLMMIIKILSGQL